MGLLFGFAVVFELEDVDLQRLLVLTHLGEDDGAGLEEVGICLGQLCLTSPCHYREIDLPSGLNCLNTR